MSFLRRLFGRAEPLAEQAAPDSASAAGGETAPDGDEEAERAANLALLKAEDERLDEFRRRQLRYARWAWRPPAQGGPRRADDGEAGDAGADGA